MTISDANAEHHFQQALALPPEQRERYAIPVADLALSESDFQRALQARLTATGHLGDVFPHMVSRNVPQFLLRRLWPELWAAFEQSPQLIMFGAAEEGWGGRLDNVAAQATRDAANNDAVSLSFRKTYVMDCASVLVLTRAAEDPAEIVLAWLPRDFATESQAGATQSWTQRTEAGLSMSHSSGADVHHYIFESKPGYVIRESSVLRIDRRKYASVAMQLGRREISSMALLALATLRHHALAVSTELGDLEEQILAARDGAKLNGRHIELARQVFRAFFEQIAQAQIELHPLWDRIRKMVDDAR